MSGQKSYSRLLTFSHSLWYFIIYNLMVLSCASVIQSSWCALVLVLYRHVIAIFHVQGGIAAVEKKKSQIYVFCPEQNTT